MKNPLNEEQIKRINEISKLPAEEQQNKLQEFLETLNPEQIEFLKQQQGHKCLFCSIANGEIKSYKIYEDEEVLAVLDIRPVNEGQAIVFPKKHMQFSTEMEDAGKIFNIANKVAKKIYENLKMDTNIFLANGIKAGQQISHMAIYVIPRKDKDKAGFNFVGEEASEEELEKIKETLFFSEEKPKVKKTKTEKFSIEPRIP